VIERIRAMAISVALAVAAIAITTSGAYATPVFIDIDYASVPGKGDTDVSVRAFFDDSALTNVGTEVVTLSSLDAFITSPTIGLNSKLFHLANTDLLCRSFPGVSCFGSTPYTATFQNGTFSFLSGVQGLHGTTSGGSNYPVNGSILFQLGFNPANSFGPLAQTRYAIPTQHVHDSLRGSIGAITPVPEPSTLALISLGLFGMCATRRGD
jgi:hypothetical protein